MGATACRACGAQPRADARFCDSCGAQMQRDAEPAEYKQVTVLFADVVHSMDIAATLGAERLREIMTEVFSRSAAMVRRYGGTVDKFTGDGLMAVFGAPIALEDHAVRACRAALDIQADVREIAIDLAGRDAIELQLRIGLNSGEVIAGRIGSGPFAYTAIGAQVGMAERMESVAPPGGVMVSGSTSRLVERAAVMGEPELVRVKGFATPVPARRLLGLAADRLTARTEPTLVGRAWELAALSGLLTRSIRGAGAVVGVMGPPGIGKTRIVRELTSLADQAHVDVVTTACESHTTGIPLYAAAGLLRAAAGANGLGGDAARAAVRASLGGIDGEDLLLVEDVLGIGDPAVARPEIDPDARRRRLVTVVNAAVLTRIAPVVYVIEDAHWVDAVSEALLADFLTVVPQTRALVLITYRPEYVGVLAHSPRSQTIALEPLDDSQISSLCAEVLGDDPSLAGLAGVIADRAAGNPFFAEELVRDLTERGVLFGERGGYRCAGPVSDVSVPGTLQSVIAARIDRLPPGAKRTLNAAAVVGSRFNQEWLRALEVEPEIDELVRAELVDQTVFGAEPEYSFRHPLIRAVAYESQLKSDRAQLHRRLVAAIEQDDHHAALIAEHLEAAGDLRAAYEWHMRAGAWSTNRDIAAAQLSWERACLAADRLPVGHPDRDAMRLAPRTLLCGTAFRRFHPDMSARFDELRELCLQVGDKAALAMGMAGMTVEHVLHGRLWEASRMGAEYMALVESLGDPDLTIGLSFGAIVAKQQTLEPADVLRWTEAVIELAGDDPTRGTFIMGSPLSATFVWRGVARWGAGLPGWREDFARASELTCEADPLSRATVIAYKYLATSRGVLLVDDEVLREIEAALRFAERSSDDMALTLLQMAYAVTLVHHGADRSAGFERIRLLRDTCVEKRFALNIVPLLNAYLAFGLADQGHEDLAVARLRVIADDMLRDGHLTNVEVTLSFLAEVLLSQGHLDEAAEQIGRLTTVGHDLDWVTRDLIVLGLRTRLAKARGDGSGYRELRDRYRAMAADLGFEGHVQWANALP